eukprot:scaffold213971_cov31-Tisochrysis_lutea.AAC.1
MPMPHPTKATAFNIAAFFLLFLIAVVLAVLLLVLLLFPVVVVVTRASLFSTASQPLPSLQLLPAHPAPCVACGLLLAHLDRIATDRSARRCVGCGGAVLLRDEGRSLLVSKEAILLILPRLGCRVEQLSDLVGERGHQARRAAATRRRLFSLSWSASSLSPVRRAPVPPPPPPLLPLYPPRRAAPPSRSSLPL